MHTWSEFLSERGGGIRKISFSDKDLYKTFCSDESNFKKIAGLVFDQGSEHSGMLSFTENGGVFSLKSDGEFQFTLSDDRIEIGPIQDNGSLFASLSNWYVEKGFHNRGFQDFHIFSLSISARRKLGANLRISLDKNKEKTGFNLIVSNRTADEMKTLASPSIRNMAFNCESIKNRGIL